MTFIYPPERYRITVDSAPDGAEVDRITERVYAQVFRTDFTEPGFALISFRQRIESISLRRFIVLLKDSLGAINRLENSRSLQCVSMMQFDQQNTTKFHLDGAPEESYLMLGHEPSGVHSELRVADYTRAANDLHLTPQQYLADFNPMFVRGE